MKPKTDEEIEKLTDGHIGQFWNGNIDDDELTKRCFRSAESELLPEIERLEAEVKRLKEPYEIIENLRRQL